MKANKIIAIILSWLPSLVISLFFIPNALDKIFNSNQAGKIVSHSATIIATGVVLLIANALFLYNKTLHIGTLILSSYMTLVVFIHMQRGKPYEVTILIVMATIFAAYMRRPQPFELKKESE
jgi:hypothetical protein